MTKGLNPIPDEFLAATPRLGVYDVDAAVDFYGKAFGADELYRSSLSNGQVLHCELLAGNARIWLYQEGSIGNQNLPVRETLTGGITLVLYFANVDEVLQKAAEAGADIIMQAEDRFWGDRYGSFRDPFGFDWGVAARNEDLSPDEISRRAREKFEK